MITAPELTDELIAAALAEADARVCAGNPRCYPFPDRLQDARAEARTTCTPKGRCKIGGTRRVIVAEGGRTSYDVWLDVHTSEGRLRRQRD